MPKAPEPRTWLRLKSERNKEDVLALEAIEGEKEEKVGGKVKEGEGEGEGTGEGAGTWHLGLSVLRPQT